MELKNNVALFTTHVQTSQSCNKSDCCRLPKICCRKYRVVLLFASVYVARFTGPRQTCFAASKYSFVWRDSRIILSNQKSVFTQLAATFICFNTDLNVDGKAGMTCLLRRSGAMLRNKLHVFVACFIYIHTYFIWTAPCLGLFRRQYWQLITWIYPNMLKTKSYKFNK